MSAAGVPARPAPHAGGLAQALARLRVALGRRVHAVPRLAWLCALVAFANGIAWSLLIPPFQVPDENAHYAYVQQVAERGTLPRVVGPEGPLSPREDAIVSNLLTFGIAGRRGNPAPFTQLQQSALEAVEAQKLSARGSGDALSATSNPPLYYALEAVPYKVVANSSVLDKLTAMRWLSALIGAITVLIVFAFLMELLPGTPRAWPVGALMVALQPLFGFMSGGVNNDDLLYLAAAGVLWGVARAFRRGLDTRSGVLIGGFLGAGLLTKLTLVAFVPAAVLAVLLLLWRERNGPERARALRGAAWAVGLAAAPVALYVLLNHVVWGRTAIPGGVGSVPSAGGRTFSFTQEVDHVWQLFLPRLWGRAQFAYSPLWETWFKGFIGRFGWLDYDFPGWVYQAARLLLLALLALVAWELVRRRDALRARLPELTVYVLAVIGLCAEIGVQSYRFLITNGGVFEQPRYLLSLLPLYAALGALAVRAPGRRWGPAVGAAIVMLALGHDLYAQAITISRYYT